MKYSILDVHLAFFFLKYDKSNPNWMKPHWKTFIYLASNLFLYSMGGYNSTPSIWRTTLRWSMERGRV